MEARKEIVSLPTTHPLPDVIGSGAAISEDILAEHVGYFKGHLGGLPSRVAEIYSIYRLITHEVSDLVCPKLEIEYRANILFVSF